MFLLITLFSTAQPIFAVTIEISGTTKWVAGQWDSEVFTTDNETSVGMLMRRLTNYTSGEQVTTFCAQHKVDSPSGEIHTGTHSVPTTAALKKACKIAYIGWYSKYGDWAMNGGIMTEENTQKKLNYCFTQQYIWESLGQSSARFINSSIQSQYEAFKVEMETKLANFERKPSFTSSTVTVDAGTTTTLTDSNGVLKDYASIDKKVNGIRIVHAYGENTMQVIVDEDCQLESYIFTNDEMESYGLIKEETRNHNTTVYISFKEGVQDQIIALNYNDPVTMSLSLKINSFGKLELSKLNKEGDLVDGAIFKVEGENYSKEVTVKGGKITLDKLKKGHYTITEIFAPEGYLLNTQSYGVEVKVNQTAKQAIVNEEPTGTFSLVKKNADGTATLEGTKYRIWNNNGYDKEFTTDKNGKITVEGLKLGTYNYQETYAINGYLLDTKTYTFELKYKDQHTSVVYANAERKNDEPTGSLSIIKKDSETGSVPQGDAKLENAIYKVYANEDIYNVAKTKKFYSKGDLVATRTTNAKGETEDVTGLPLGKYLVKEEKAPIGYMIDETKYEVNLTYKDQHTKIITGSVTSTDKVKKMQVHIYKSGIKENSGLVPGLEGAEFTIKLYTDVQEALAAGYSYAEVWNGLNEYGESVSVDSKRVAAAQKIAPSYESIVTDENGDAYTQNKLAYGKYLVKETKTPKDYYVSSDFTFTISEDESEVKEIAKKVKHLYVNNEQMETYIKLVKKDEDSEKIVTLNNATFQIKASKDIFDRGNGKIIYKKGEVITQKVGSTVYNSFTTNSDNLVVPDGSFNNVKDEKGAVVTPLLLPVGEYEVTEIKIPSGYLELESPVKFKVETIKDYDQDNTGDYIKTVEIKNEKPFGTLIVDKSVALKENVDTSIVDISDLSKIQFKLSAKEDVIDPADGSIIYKKGQEVNTYNVDKNGDLKVENLPMGTYELQEIKTLDGLVLNETIYEVKFTQEDIKTKVYTETREVINDTTLVEISKTTITGDKELPGAKLSVIDENGKVIDTWTSTDKTHTIEGLTVGKEYTLREDLAPLGYVKATDVKFKVENTSEMQKVVMVDKIVEMTKADISGEEIEGAELKVYDKDGNIIDEWTSTKEPHKIKNLVEGETYILHEEYAPEGYVIASDIEFTVSTDKETQKIEMIDKIVEMSKKSIAGEELEGATIVVTNKRTKNIVDKWVSSKESHKIKGLIEGETYIMHEEIAIDGYVKATDIEFIVSKDKETQKVEMIDKIVLVSKTDLVTGEELPGAELTITDKDGNVIDKWTSTDEPHQVTGLEEDQEYTLTEVTSPYGYEIAESIKFKVTTDKETQLIEMKDMPILKTIKVIKVDSDTKETIKENFKFAIYEDAECTKLIKEVKADKESGTVAFDDLRYGIYYIKETKAPKGYQLLDKIVKIEISDKGTFADGELLEDNNSICTFNYYNKQIPKIQTGNEMNYFILLGSIIISLLGITTGIIILKRNKKNN